MRNTCPFCGKGDYATSWKPRAGQMMRDMHQRIQLSEYEIAEFNRLMVSSREIVAQLQRKNSRIKRDTIRKTLEGVCGFLKHYNLVELRNR